MAGFCHLHVQMTPGSAVITHGLCPVHVQLPGNLILTPSLFLSLSDFHWRIVKDPFFFEVRQPDVFENLVAFS